jgi:hypothetical protein
VRAAAVRIAGRDLAPDLIAMTGKDGPARAGASRHQAHLLNLPEADAAAAKLLASNMARIRWFAKARSRDARAGRPRLPKLLAATAHERERRTAACRD